MNRLSPLQIQILQLALANHRNPRLSTGEPITYLRTCEILHHCFGWEVDNRWTKQPIRELYGHVFSKSQKGKKYNSANASVCRAIARLEKRGLVRLVCGAYSHWSGLELTETGVTTAELVKSPAILPKA